jgi:hypothetical protein
VIRDDAYLPLDGAGAGRYTLRLRYPADAGDGATDRWLADLVIPEGDIDG